MHLITKGNNVQGMWMQILTKSLVESGKWKVGIGLATYKLEWLGTAEQ